MTPVSISHISDMHLSYKYGPCYIIYAEHGQKQALLEGPTANVVIAEELLKELSIRYDSISLSKGFIENECRNELYSAVRRIYFEDLVSMSTKQAIVCMMSTVLRSGYGIYAGNSLQFVYQRHKEYYLWQISRISMMSPRYRLVAVSADRDDTYKITFIDNTDNRTVFRVVNEHELAQYVATYDFFSAINTNGCEMHDTIRSNLSKLVHISDNRYLDVAKDMTSRIYNIEEILDPAFQWPKGSDCAAYVDQWKEALRYFFSGYIFYDRINDIQTAPHPQIVHTIRIYSHRHTAGMKDPIYDKDADIPQDLVENYTAKPPHIRSLYHMLFDRWVDDKNISTHYAVKQEWPLYKSITTAYQSEDPASLLYLNPLFGFQKP